MKNKVQVSNGYQLVEELGGAALIQFRPSLRSGYEGEPAFAAARRNIDYSGGAFSVTVFRSKQVGFIENQQGRIPVIARRMHKSLDKLPHECFPLVRF
jgi:hypothetical protein